MTAQPPHSIGDAIRTSLPTYEAPAALHEWARSQAAGASRERQRPWRGAAVRRMAYAAGLVIAAATGWVGQRAYTASDGSRDRRSSGSSRRWWTRTFDR